MPSTDDIVGRLQRVETLTVQVAQTLHKLLDELDRDRSIDQNSLAAVGEAKIKIANVLKEGAFPLK